jgi:hypothetical protein
MGWGLEGVAWDSTVIGSFGIPACSCASNSIREIHLSLIFLRLKIPLSSTRPVALQKDSHLTDTPHGPQPPRNDIEIIVQGIAAVAQ